MTLKYWVKATLISWGAVDMLLVALALYMQRILELGL